ncbi:52 kDa repressor of the inhibitor of the protein kinase-like, partial [Aphis craccivora]
MLKEKNFRHLANMITPLVNSLQLVSIHVKLRWISNEYDHEKNRIQNLCINTAENIFNNDVTNNSNYSDKDDKNFIIFSSQPVAKTVKKVDLEVSKSLNILNNYPIVKKLFIRFNTSLCSSEPVERMFSMAGFINNPTRNKLSDSTFEKLDLGHYNYYLIV